MLSFDFFPEILQRKIIAVSVITEHVQFIAHFRQIPTSITQYRMIPLGLYHNLILLEGVLRLHFYRITPACEE